MYTSKMSVLYSSSSLPSASILVVAALFLLAPEESHQQKQVSSIPQPSVSSTPATDFTCPEDFGYFPHPSDCTQYYVCVFGGALLESCTGGLMYSHDLQTCDWPRNVYCYNGTGFVDNNIESSQGQVQQQPQRGRSRGASSSPAAGPTPRPSQNNNNNNPSSYAYNPIKIETYGQLSRAAEESIGGKKVQNQRVVLPDDEYQQQRSGRSYEGSLPNYKEEIYQSNQGRGGPGELCPKDSNNNDSNNGVDKQRKKRSSNSSSVRNTTMTIGEDDKWSNHTITRRHSIFSHAMSRSRRRKPNESHHHHHHHNSRADYHHPMMLTSRRLDFGRQLSLSKYKMVGKEAGLKTKPLPRSGGGASLSHRVSSPGNILYPSSYYQTPTYGFVNIDSVRNSGGGGGGGGGGGSSPPRLRPNPPSNSLRGSSNSNSQYSSSSSSSSSSNSTPPPPRVVKITTSKPGRGSEEDENGSIYHSHDNAHDGSYFSSQNLRLLNSNKFNSNHNNMVLGEYHDNSYHPHHHNNPHHHHNHHHHHPQHHFVMSNGNGLIPPFHHNPHNNNNHHRPQQNPYHHHHHHPFNQGPPAHHLHAHSNHHHGQQLVKQKQNHDNAQSSRPMSSGGGLSVESGFLPNSRWKLVSNLGHEGYYTLEVMGNKDKNRASSSSSSSGTTSQYGHDNNNQQHHLHHQLSDLVTNAYVTRLKGTSDNNNNNNKLITNLKTQQQLPNKTTKPATSSVLPFIRSPTRDTSTNNNQHSGSVSSSPLVNTNTRSKYGGSSKYYDNAAPAVQQQPQEDYSGDDVYVNQRYAANVGNNSQYYYAPATGEEDDASYYVYDDEEDDSSANNAQQGQNTQKFNNNNNNDFDYKYTTQQQYSRTPVAPTPQQIITRRPVQTVAQPVNPTTATKTSTRTRTRTNSASSSPSSSSSGTSSGTRSRPTLKPKSSIVKSQSAPVRDVYLDPPSRPDNVYETPATNSPATKCRKDLCVLPDCNCGGKDIPGGLRAQETPQIVLLTFDDSVNDLNKNLYRDLFEKGRKNPNGCPISATFYISHEWTDYSQVQNLAADGHEIASHSVSHSFGEQYSQKKWDREINGQREILAAYGGVKLSEIRGMRAPFLAIGGNNMFKMLHDANFTYDSSMPIYENRPPSWPYTLDYRIFHDCMIPPCPTKSYPGVWEVPMVMWQDLKGGRCSMGDACSNPPTAEGVYQMLAKNFERHYTTNRAPFGLYYHAAWFTQPHHKEGFEAFLDTLVQMDDVWLVTNWQALQWIRNPTPSSRILNFEPWSCHDLKDRPPRCNHPKVCNLWHKSGVRYMKTCQQCPQQYPWTGNTGVPYSNSV